MKLTSMDFSGFKSFADLVRVGFPSDLVAIVGPNGCGKSNIIDGIRWVMGELSAKYLRGQSMADVIFNGSSGRQPLGRASVTLRFDNTDRSIGGEYAKYAEIEIRREVNRDGQSHYYLNGTLCRRRDIMDIFIGTGLGPRSYAVIEQGMISRFIDAKPDELRGYIEEAAGVTKYKDRRRETENRIKRTRENLQRLTDIREELGKQLQTLQRQAKAAERFKVLKAEERDVKGQLHALRWQGLETEASALASQLELNQTALLKVQTELTEIDTQMEVEREKQHDLNDGFNQIQGEFYAKGTEIATLEQSIQHARARSEEIQTNLIEAQVTIKQYLEQIQQEAQERDALTTELATLAPNSEAAKTQQQAREEALISAESQMRAWQSEWDQYQQDLNELKRALQAAQMRAEHAEQQIAQLQSSRIANQAEFDAINIEGFSQQAEESREAVANYQVKQEQFEGLAQTLSADLKEKQQAIQTMEQTLSDARSQLQKTQGRRASLEALQEVALGKRESGLQAWLDKQGLSQEKRLAELLHVSPVWTSAVETVLSETLQAVCVDDFNSLVGTIASLEKTDASFYLKQANHTKLANTHLSNLPSLASVIDTAVTLPDLLYDIFLVENVATGMAQLSSLRSGQSFITPEGIWFSAQWLRVKGERDEKTGVLQREQELKEIQDLIATQELAVQNALSALSGLREALQTKQREQEDLRRELNQLLQSLASSRADLQLHERECERAKTRRAQLSEQLNQQVQKLALSESQKITESEAAQRMQSQLSALSAEQSERQSDKSRIEAHLHDLRVAANEQRTLVHQLDLSLQSQTLRLRNLEDNKIRLEQQIERAKARQGELGQQLAEVKSPVESMQTDLKARLAEQLALEKKLKEAKVQLNQTDARFRDWQTVYADQSASLNQLREKGEKLRLNHQSITVRQSTIQEQLTELDLDLKTLLETMPEEANVKAWEAHLEELAKRITRLGPINLAAIDEYDLQSERKAYLDKQNDDLTQALSTLEKAIAKIDKETKSLFKHTFDRVNKEFQAYFPRLFGGGNASLELVGDDLLEAGVSLIARPPGKRNATVHLLSGGEKALTAIALVFSIFKLNPAPFCLLDEVDAPLDDANVVRFCELVKEMSSQVQFAFITHNKVTMEMAQQLIGVTMQEPGVSRLVAVDIEEAVALAEA